jgi:nucleoside-diphosphate-sugar epimerase
MEQMSLLWSPKLPIVLARPFNYTGINQSENFLIPKIVKHFKAKQPYIELGNIDVWRDFGDVRAVANAYVGLAEKANAEDVFNICTGKLHALRDVIALCRDITQHDIEVIVNPAFIRENEVKSLCGDVTKLKNLIPDWEVPPLKTTLEWMLKS